MLNIKKLESGRHLWNLKLILSGIWWIFCLRSWWNVLFKIYRLGGIMKNLLETKCNIISATREIYINQPGYPLISQNTTMLISRTTQQKRKYQCGWDTVAETTNCPWYLNAPLPFYNRSGLVLAGHIAVQIETFSFFSLLCK